ncbi:MAG: winged helix-turn-helix transcriptional regulator [Parvularculaceae bacterium]|nr:winged helix-turn-helix transcriptional regulator [Parvularculaceae bacterium]
MIDRTSAPKPGAEILERRADEIAALLKALSHPTRLMVACELKGGERSVSALERTIGAAQPNLSRDLARMRREGLVSARRQSKSVYYQLADDRLGRVIDALCDAFDPKAGVSGKNTVRKEMGKKKT